MNSILHFGLYCDYPDGTSGAVNNDDNWTPGSKCVPNGPKPVREKRDGAKNEAVEKLQEDAKKRLEGQTISKRPVPKKKPKGWSTELPSLLCFFIYTPLPLISTVLSPAVYGYFSMIAPLLTLNPRYRFDVVVVHAYARDFGALGLR